MPPNLEKLGYNCFSETDIGSIDFSDCVKLEIIGAFAFEKCNKLSSVVGLENAAMMHTAAFAGCLKLKMRKR